MQIRDRPIFDLLDMGRKSNSNDSDKTRV